MTPKNWSVAAAIVKGNVAGYALNVASNHSVSLPVLARILREIANELENL